MSAVSGMTLPAHRRVSAFGRALWAAPPRAHLAALAVVLLALVPVVGLDAEFSSDESASIVQARSLGRDGTWYLDHPFPAGDPAGTAFPLPRSARTEHGWAPQPKHPLYSVLLAGADRAGGVAGLVVLSVIGTLGAAWAGGMIARRLHPGLVRPAIWTLGVASPLFVDSFLVMAHALAAAAAGVGALFGLRALEGGSRRDAAAMAAALGLGVLLRSEALLLGVSFGVGLVGFGVVRRRPRGTILGAVALLAVLLAYAGEGAVEQELFGSRRGFELSEAPGAAAERGLVADRVRGLSMSWLRPSYEPVGLGAMLSISAVLTGAGAVVAARRPRPNATQIALLGAVTGLLVTVRLVVPAASPDVVPGLLVAFPLLVWGLVGVRRATLDLDDSQILLGSTALFAAAVLATQYPEGGAWEWGGRYFAVGVPLVAPVLLHALLVAGRGLGPAARRAGLAAVVLTGLALAGIGVGAVRETHRSNEALSTGVRAATLGTEPGDGGPPVIVATELGLPRVSWRWLDDARWLFSEPSDIGSVLDGIRRAGVTRTVVATLDGTEVATRAGEARWRVSAGAPTPVDEAWWIVVLESG